MALVELVRLMVASGVQMVITLFLEQLRRLAVAVVVRIVLYYLVVLADLVVAAGQ